MNIYEKCLKRKGEKIANKMVMLNAGVSRRLLMVCTSDVVTGNKQRLPSSNARRLQ